MRKALEFAKMTFEHAIELEYLGEGSTLGMAKDAISKIDAALSNPQPDLAPGIEWAIRVARRCDLYDPSPAMISDWLRAEAERQNIRLGGV